LLEFFSTGDSASS